MGDITAANLDSVFSDTAGLTLTITSGNFYLNGATMNAGAWNLNNRNADDTLGLDYDEPSGWPYGTVYAAAFNGTVGSSNATGSAVAAAEATDGTGNTNWDFAALAISSVETVYDNVIRVTFSAPVENGHNEIWNAVTYVSADINHGSLWLNTTGTPVRYTGAYLQRSLHEPDKRNGRGPDGGLSPDHRDNLEHRRHRFHPPETITAPTEKDYPGTMRQCPTR